jgi:maltooligosyltrehalose synthase
LLKLTVPGVPDFYQGTEFWDLSLVDPDNRRPVDFDARKATLDDTPLVTLARSWRDGRIKQAMIARALAARRSHPQVFSEGSYEPLAARGEHADRVVAFARRAAGDTVIVVAPRIASSLLQNSSINFAAGAWKDTAIATGGNDLFVDVLRHAPVRSSAQMLLRELLSELPVCLLISRKA